jgi:hypothetical protein
VEKGKSIQVATGVKMPPAPMPWLWLRMLPATTIR